MNKYQLAINQLKQYLPQEFDTSTQRQKVVIEDSLILLQELIDKSMPKKFKKINKYEYECPSCKELYDLNDVSYNYCPNCSQKIDWSDFI